MWLNFQSTSMTGSLKRWNVVTSRFSSLSFSDGDSDPLLVPSVSVTVVIVQPLLFLLTVYGTGSPSQVLFLLFNQFYVSVIDRSEKYLTQGQVRDQTRLKTKDHTCKPFPFWTSGLLFSNDCVSAWGHLLL